MAGKNTYTHKRTHLQRMKSSNIDGNLLTMSYCCNTHTHKVKGRFSLAYLALLFVQNICCFVWFPMFDRDIVMLSGSEMAIRNGGSCIGRPISCYFWWYRRLLHIHPNMMYTNRPLWLLSISSLDNLVNDQNNPKTLIWSHIDQFLIDWS